MVCVSTFVEYIALGEREKRSQVKIADSQFDCPGRGGGRGCSEGVLTAGLQSLT